MLVYFLSDDFVSEVVIGDNHQRNCDSNSIPYDKKRHIVQDLAGNKELTEVEIVQDGSLAPSTNYTGYVLIKVQGPNETVSGLLKNHFTLSTYNNFCSEKILFFKFNEQNNI